MFIVNNNNPLKIIHTEGDFGIVLPIELIVEDDETITSEDTFSVSIFKKINTEPLIIKTYSNIENNTIEFSLTEQETLLLSVGDYYYDLDWYQNGQFMCNLVPKQTYSVIEKGKKVGVDNES